MNLFRLYATLGLRADEFNKGVDQAENRGSAMAGKVKAGFAKIGAAAVAMGALAIRAGMEIDDSMRAISATTGMTEEDINKVERAFRDMALEGNFTAAEISGAMARIAVSGQDAGDAISIMEAATTLAAATGKDLGDTAYFLGNYLLKVGKDSSYAEKYIDVFAQGMANSNIGLADMQNYLFRMTPAFNQFGSSVETNVGIMTRLYQAGVRGAALYSGMGTIMMDFGVSGEMTAEMLERFNVQMVDSNGNVRDNKDLMFDLAIAMNEYGDQTEVSRIITENMNLQQQQAWFEFMQLAEGIRDEVIPSLYAAGNAADGMGIAYQMAEQRTGGIRNEIGRFRNGLTELKLSLFDVIEAPFGQTMGNFNDTMRRVATSALPILKTGLRGLITVVGGVLSVVGTLMPAIVALTTAFVAWKATLAVQAVATKFIGFINAATAAKTAFAAATTASNVATIAGGKAVTLLGGIMAIFTSKTKLATAAIVAKNIAMKANLIGLVIAGVAALATGIAYLATRTRAQTEEQIRLNEETARLREETDSFIESAQAKADAHAEAVENIENEVESNRRLIQELRESRAAYDGSVESRARLMTSMQRVNEVMGDVNLQYGMEIELLDQTIDSLDSLNEARGEQARAAEALRRSLEIAEEIADADRRRAEIAQQLNEAREQGLDTTERVISTDREESTVVVEKTEAYQDLLDQYEAVASGLDELAAEQERVTAIVTESNAAIIESKNELEQAFYDAQETYGEFSEQAIEAFFAAKEASVGFSEETIEAMLAAGQAIEELTEKQLGALEALGSEYERLRDRATNAFSQLSTEASVNLDEAAQNVEHNSAVVLAQAENTAYGIARAVRLGGDDVLDYLNMFAAQGAGYAHALANDSEESLVRLIEAFRNGGEDALKAMGIQFGLQDDVLDAVTDLVYSTETTLRSQLEAAKFDEMGIIVTGSFASGMNDTVDEAVGAAENMVDEVTSATESGFEIGSPSRLYIRYGENLPTSLATGIGRKMSDAVRAITDMATSVVGEAESGLADWIFENIGNNAISGLVNSINNGTHPVVTAMTNMANQAVAAANAALQISSPSRIFTNMGKNVVKSFADSVIDNQSLVRRSMDRVFGGLDRDISVGFQYGSSITATPLPAFSRNSMADSSRAGGITVNFYGDNNFESDADIDDIARRLAHKADIEIRRRGVPSYG